MVIQFIISCQSILFSAPELLFFTPFNLWRSFRSVLRLMTIAILITSASFLVFSLAVSTWFCLSSVILQGVFFKMSQIYCTRIMSFSPVECFFYKEGNVAEQVCCPNLQIVMSDGCPFWTALPSLMFRLKSVLFESIHFFLEKSVALISSALLLLKTVLRPSRGERVRFWKCISVSLTSDAL